MATNWVVLGLLSAIFAALVAVLARIGLQEVDATLATTLRAILMAAALVAACAATGRLVLVPSVSPSAWGFIALSGAAGAASWLCYFLAIQTGSASQAAALDR